MNINAEYFQLDFCMFLSIPYSCFRTMQAMILHTSWDGKVHGATMGPTWVLSAPEPYWPHEPCYQGSTGWLCVLSVAIDYSESRPVIFVHRIYLSLCRKSIYIHFRVGRFLLSRNGFTVVHWERQSSISAYTVHMQIYCPLHTLKFIMCNMHSVCFVLIAVNVIVSIIWAGILCIVWYCMMWHY